MKLCYILTLHVQTCACPRFRAIEYQDLKETRNRRNLLGIVLTYFDMKPPFKPQVDSAISGKTLRINKIVM